MSLLAKCRGQDRIDSPSLTQKMPRQLGISSQCKKEKRKMKLLSVCDFFLSLLLRAPLPLIFTSVPLTFCITFQVVSRFCGAVAGSRKVRGGRTMWIKQGEGKDWKGGDFFPSGWRGKKDKLSIFFPLAWCFFYTFKLFLGCCFCFKTQDISNV